MGLINDLLKKIFGNDQQKNEPTNAANTNAMARWEKEREERIIAAEGRLKDWVAASLKEKGSLSFSWESGNDEAFVTFEDKTGENEENFEDLEETLTMPGYFQSDH